MINETRNADSMIEIITGDPKNLLFYLKLVNYQFLLSKNLNSYLNLIKMNELEKLGVN
jgi:hypothetical protein